MPPKIPGVPNMKKNIALITAVVVLGAGAYFSQKEFLQSRALNTPTRGGDTSLREESPPRESSPETLWVTIIVDGKSYNGEVKEGATVLDAMNSLATNTDFRFTSKDFSGMGAFVESISGKINADGFYWILYINGKQSVAGASQTHVIYGDSIEWRYESR